jgi:hypothetical protein
MPSGKHVVELPFDLQGLEEPFNQKNAATS